MTQTGSRAAVRGRDYRLTRTRIKKRPTPKPLQLLDPEPLVAHRLLDSHPMKLVGLEQLLHKVHAVRAYL